MAYEAIMTDLYQTSRSNVTEHFLIYIKRKNWTKKQLVGNSDKLGGKITISREPDRKGI